MKLELADNQNFKTAWDLIKSDLTHVTGDETDVTLTFATAGESQIVVLGATPMFYCA